MRRIDRRIECVQEGAVKILKGRKMKRKDKSVERTDRLERGYYSEEMRIIKPASEYCRGED